MALIGLGVCVYCERDPNELVALELAVSPEDALYLVRRGQNEVQMCVECLHRFVSEAETGDNALEAILLSPVEFPPGVTAVEHCCSQLQFEGKSDEEATSIIQMHRDGRYYVAHCPHCGIEVRSEADNA